jgi:hypothetical protein
MPPPKAQVTPKSTNVGQYCQVTRCERDNEDATGDGQQKATEKPIGLEIVLEIYA